MPEKRPPSDEFIDVLGRILPADVPVALLDFPQHDNPGDAAIWMGEMRALADSGHRVVYAAALNTFDPRRLDRLLPADGVVLVHGGGNFGDLWPRHQAHRERIITELRNRTIVQLPQTVRFKNLGAGDDSLERFANHPHFTVMARDRSSLGLLAAAGLDAHLSSDPTTALWPNPAAPHRPTAHGQTLFLLRSDHERRLPIPSSLDPVARDWTDLGVGQEKIGTGSHLVDRALAAVDRKQGEFGRALPATCRPRIARQRRHSSRLVASAVAAVLAHDVVVTDRLHGMLFALACGRPVIAVDTGYGKLDGYADAFLGDNRLLHRLPDFSEVNDVLNDLGTK